MSLSAHQNNDRASDLASPTHLLLTSRIPDTCQLESVTIFATLVSWRTQPLISGAPNQFERPILLQVLKLYRIPFKIQDTSLSDLLSIAMRALIICCLWHKGQTHWHLLSCPGHDPLWLEHNTSLFKSTSHFDFRNFPLPPPPGISNISPLALTIAVIWPWSGDFVQICFNLLSDQSPIIFLWVTRVDNVYPRHPLKEGFTKKVAVLLDFVQITLWRLCANLF